MKTNTAAPGNLLIWGAQLYLWAALLEDSASFVLAWVAPDIWFRIFHHTTGSGLEIAFLRRSAGQWAAFAIGQAATLALWRKFPVWLAIAAALRFSDLFTDVSYLLSAPHLTPAAWFLLSPPAPLNLIGVVLLLYLYAKQRPNFTWGHTSPGRVWAKD